jgi:L-fuculose-phosphate aldolase
LDAVPRHSPEDGFQDVLEAVFLHARKLVSAGLVVGSSGNVSARIPGHRALAITPTSVPYDAMTAGQVVVVSLETGQAIESGSRPSTELPTHLAIYRSREDVGAVIHTHGPYVSTLAVLRRPLPPVIDEMIVRFGGTVEVAEYAFAGTEALSSNVVAALGDRAGALLANHGNVCVGIDLEEAFHVALTMEATSRIYLETLRTGVPVLLPDSSLQAGRALYKRGHQRGRS